jgi:hypothetical protein
MKSVYIAARAKYRSEEVAEVQGKVKKLGYKIAYDWPSGNSEIKRPYRAPSHRKQNSSTQAEMLKAAAKADIFIFLDDPGLRGAYVELGAFLTDCLQNPKERKAYIVGPESHEREFIFESPEYVIFADNIEGVYKDLDQH